jgi:hypothetical protein
MGSACLRGPVDMRQLHTTRSFPIVYILGGYGQAPGTTSASATCSIR